MKKLIIVAGLLAILAINSLAADILFVGSMRSTKYHYVECPMAKRIYRKNIVLFNSPEEAISRGYSPCKICRPPTKGE